MFRELAYITLIVSIAAFGTEIIFRFKPENQALGGEYITQSNLVIASTLTVIIASLGVVRNVERIPKLAMKALMLVILTPLIAAIALRSKFGFFMPLDDKRFNVYNATSFFLCVATISWATFWFFRKESPLIDPEIALAETERRRNQRSDRARSRNRPPSLNRYDEEIDYTLPSYSEVPPPPSYNKAISVDGDLVERIPPSTTEQPNPDSSAHVTPEVMNEVDISDTGRDSINHDQVNRQSIDENATIGRSEHSTRH